MSKTVSDMPTWNLEALYANAEAWEADFARLQPLAEAYAAFRGHLADSADTLLAALQAADEFSRLSDKLYAYASHKCDEDTRVADSKSRVGLISAALAEMSPCFAWFEPELLAIPEMVMDMYLRSPKLTFYKRSLEESLRARKHTLSEAEERLLGTFSDVLGASGDIFESLNDTDLTFGKVRDSKGKRQELTHGSYHRFMEDANRDVRHEAYTKLYTTYEQFRNTFAQILNTTVRQHVVSARTRHFRSSLDAALYPDNVPTTVYTKLIDSVHGRLKHLHHYLEVRRRVLKLDKLDMWDFYTPLLPQCRFSFTWPEAAALAKEALKPMGADYCAIFERAFTERWMDVPERKGKRSGAYSGGCYDSFPYILLNFQGTLDDVFTLVHEGGHSLHSYYSHTNQEYHYADYKIFVAEVASTTNEILLADHLLKTSDKPELKAYLLSHLADEIRMTIYRQTMFAEFELLMHKASEKQETLTADWLDETYYSLNNRYHGFEADRLIRLEWARIPHFHYNFYVYKYATGMSAAIKLANDILKEGDPALQRYLDFLKAGSSRDVLDIMRDAGVDLEKPDTVRNALDYFGSIVEQLDKLVNVQNLVMNSGSFGRMP